MAGQAMVPGVAALPEYFSDGIVEPDDEPGNQLVQSLKTAGRVCRHMHSGADFSMSDYRKSWRILGSHSCRYSSAFKGMLCLAGMLLGKFNQRGR